MKYTMSISIQSIIFYIFYTMSLQAYFHLGNWNILVGKGVERISLRLEPKGKSLKDEELVSALGLPATNAQLFLRDLVSPLLYLPTTLVTCCREPKSHGRL